MLALYGGVGTTLLPHAGHPVLPALDPRRWWPERIPWRRCSTRWKTRKPTCPARRAPAPWRCRARSSRPCRRALLQAGNAVRRGLQAVTLTLRQVNGNSLDASHFAPLSAALCVRKAVEEYAYENAEQRARVSVRIDGDFMFQGEETACVLILFNPLKNALYYLPLHPQATITIAVENTPAHRILVRDTGPGIPPARLADLFEEFHSFGKAEGTGLGLAFCRRAMTTARKPCASSTKARVRTSSWRACWGCKRVTKSSSR
jgi:signal transduction histidine kinase